MRKILSFKTSLNIIFPRVGSLLLVRFFLSFFIILLISNSAFSYGGLPECLGSASAVHRKTCKDLIDLPICNLIPADKQIAIDPVLNTASDPSKVNCIRECKDLNNPNTSAKKPLVRGTDYAIHGVNCIRFCDAKDDKGIIKENDETVVAPDGQQMCTSRLCHQLPKDVVPKAGENCKLISCNLLTLDELKDGVDSPDKTRFNDPNRQYCSAEDRCYDFSEAKLPYIKYRLENPMCIIHNCSPVASDVSCKGTTDDVFTIKQKGDSYVAAYTKYIDPLFGTPEDAICEPLDCKPVFYRKYICSSASTDGPLVVPDESCDKTSTCTDGFCYKKIDCNSQLFQNELECNNSIYDTPISPGAYSPLSETDYDRRVKAWFYRPAMQAGIENTNIDKGGLCYQGIDAMKENGWGKTVFGLFFHAGASQDSPRGPGLCGLSHNTGTRGVGRAYLCGSNGTNGIPSSDFGYVDGYAKADYSANPAIYQLKVCLRYKNAGRLNVCGERECSPDCGFNLCKIQWCGKDLCKILTIDSQKPKACTDPYYSNGDCKQDMGPWGSANSYLRVRAVKVDKRHICSLLDYYDQNNNLTNNGAKTPAAVYMDGKETTKEGICFDGTKDKAGICNGRDSNAGSSKLDLKLFMVWRAFKPILYISEDYKDFEGRPYKAQGCAKIPLRIGPPRWYKIANEITDPRLFSPMLYINRVFEIRGGEESQNYSTDFHYPEIEVKFGETAEKLSLEVDKTGLDGSRSAESAKDVTYKYASKVFTASVFLTKEFDSITGRPIACLYRKQQAQDGSGFNKKIACVNRNKPEVDGKVGTFIRKAIVYSSPANTYTNFTLNMKLLISAGTNDVSDKCTGDDECSKEMVFANPKLNPSDPGQICQAAENYNFCATREPCSELLNECVQNELALVGLNPYDANYAFTIAKKAYCDKDLLPRCNKMWGIDNNVIRNVAEFVDDIPLTSLRPKSSDLNAYGWFNEACVNSGFESKLVEVVALKSRGGEIKGRCVPDSSANAEKCIDGGNAAKGCPCLKTNGKSLADLGFDNNYEIRLQTPREAGLCIDIPSPRNCPAINYGLNSDNPLDLYFVDKSLNKDGYDASGAPYNDSSNVHNSHKLRSNNTNYGHADFESTFSGAIKFRGTCNGFWKSNLNAGGVPIRPAISCKLDGTWDITALTSACIRYECPLVETSGAIDSGGSNNAADYSGNYAIGETGDNKGLFHGFANWGKKTKTNDFTESVKAQSCIVGFKPAGSTLDKAKGEFVGGTLPERSCGQTGLWIKAKTQCERVKCPAVNPPTNPITDSDYRQWVISGGATFREGKASRSKTAILGEDSIIEGECYDGPNIKFFQSPGSPKPTRTCNYLGEWGPVQNACGTQCKPIDTAAEANTDTSGFSYWQGVTGVQIGGSAVATLDTSRGEAGCYTDRGANPPVIYVKSPYSPKGQANIFNEGGAVTQPTKRCVSIVSSDNKRQNVWEQTQNGCVNYCPGRDEDPRIGIGVTEHNSSQGKLKVKWAKTELGKDAYAYPKDVIDDNDKYPDGIAIGDFRAAYFDDNHGPIFMLKRHCNENGKWSDPIPMCSMQNGNEIKNAKTYSVRNYGAGATASDFDIGKGYVLGTSLSAQSCVPNYRPKDKNNANIPLITCNYKNDEKKIDEVYWSGLSCERITCQLYYEREDCPESKIINSVITKLVGDEYLANAEDIYAVAFVGFFYKKCYYPTDLLKSATSNVVYADGNGLKPSAKVLNAGEQVYAFCKNYTDYGHAITSDKRSLVGPTDATCGVGNFATVKDPIVTYRTTKSPILKCVQDKDNPMEGKIEVENECQPCKKCLGGIKLANLDIGMNYSCKHRDSGGSDCVNNEDEGCWLDDRRSNTCEGFFARNSATYFTCRIHVDVSSGKDYIKLGDVNIHDSDSGEKKTWYSTQGTSFGSITTACLDGTYKVIEQICKQ